MRHEQLRKLFTELTGRNDDFLSAMSYLVEKDCGATLHIIHSQGLTARFDKFWLLVLKHC